MPTASPWLRSHNRRMMHLLYVLLAVPALAATVWFLLTWNARVFTLMILMVLANIVNIINAVMMKRLRRRVTRHRGLLCTGCLYVLEGLEPAGQCPECGRDYTFQLTADAWARDFGPAVRSEQALKETPGHMPD